MAMGCHRTGCSSSQRRDLEGSIYPGSLACSVLVGPSNSLLKPQAIYAATMARRVKARPIGSAQPERRRQRQTGLGARAATHPQPPTGSQPVSLHTAQSRGVHPDV